MTRRVWAGLAMAIALGGGTAGVIVVTQGGGGAPEGTANIWIDTNGGTCTRSATAVAYVDAAACATFDAAWDAMSAGDTARVANGTYGDQTVTGNKTSATYIIGSNPGVTISGYDTGGEGDGNYAYLQDMVIDVGSGNDWAGGFNGNNMTIDGVDIHGPYASVGFRGDNVTWKNGELHDDNSESGERTCPMYEPVVMIDAENLTIDNIIFWEQRAKNGGTAPECGGDPNYHLEYIRNEHSDNLHIFNSHFHGDPGGEPTTGYLFFTLGDTNGFWSVNNVFEFFTGGDPNTVDISGTTSNCADWLIAYSSWDAGWATCPNDTGKTWVGNLGSFQGCDTNIKNVWKQSGSCGTDTFLNTTFSGLGIGADGVTLDTGSPAIDAAETPGASDYCTDAATVNSRDLEGTVRPDGSVCDAGPDEREE